MYVIVELASPITMQMGWIGDKYLTGFMSGRERIAVFELQFKAHLSYKKINALLL